MWREVEDARSLMILLEALCLPKPWYQTSLKELQESRKAQAVIVPAARPAGPPIAPSAFPGLRSTSPLIRKRKLSVGVTGLGTYAINKRRKRKQYTPSYPSGDDIFVRFERVSLVSLKGRSEWGQA